MTSKIYKSDADDIERQRRKVTNRIDRAKSPAEKDKGHLSLAILQTLGTNRTEEPLAQQLLRLLRDLQR